MVGHSTKVNKLGLHGKVRYDVKMQVNKLGDDIKNTNFLSWSIIFTVCGPQVDALIYCKRLECPTFNNNKNNPLIIPDMPDNFLMKERTLIKFLQ